VAPDDKTDDGNPFAVLKGLLDKVPSKPLPPATPAPAAQDARAVKGPARAVVRIERKGRGGKEATVVEKLELKPAELAAWLKEMKQSLGCGGQVEEDAIVLQGDQRDRVVGFLEKKGVGRVIRG